MIGRTVRRRSGFQKAWLVWLCAGVGLALGDLLMKHDDLLILSFAPLGLAIAFLAARRSPFAVYFDIDGIVVLTAADTFIPYNCIETISYEYDDICRGMRSFPFEVVHSDGVLSFPAYLSVRSLNVVDFLHNFLPEDDLISAAAELKPYIQHYEREFSSEQVRDYRCLPDPSVERNWFGLIVSFTLAFLAIFWIGIGQQSARYSHWTGVGGLAFAGAFSVLLSWLVTTSKNSNANSIRDGGLAITPVGFALKQGNLCGQMRWDEVTDIKYRREQRRVRISFEGGEIVLRDVYDAKLSRIFYRLIDNWEGLLDYSTSFDPYREYD